MTIQIFFGGLVLTWFQKILLFNMKRLRKVHPQEEFVLECETKCRFIINRNLPYDKLFQGFCFEVARSVELDESISLSSLISF